jgi:hypothetical protein
VSGIVRENLAFNKRCFCWVRVTFMPRHSSSTIDYKYKFWQKKRRKCFVSSCRFSSSSCQVGNSNSNIIMYILMLLLLLWLYCGSFSFRFFAPIRSRLDTHCPDVCLF